MSGFTLVVTAMLAVSAAVAAPQEGERSQLQKQFEARRVELENCQAALENRYLVLEAAWQEAAGRRADVLARTTEILRGALPGMQERFAAAKGGRTPPRAAQLALARDELAAVLAAEPPGDVDPAFAAPFAARLAESLLPYFDDPARAGLDATVAESLGPLLDPARPFGELWNDLLHEHVPEARAYGSAHAAYIELGQKLERARAPEIFDETGQKVPPGMVPVKGGSYAFGPHGGWPRKGLEKRGRKTSIKSFYLDRHEVTNADYLAFWSTLPPEERSARVPRNWEKGGELGHRIPDGRAEHPVTSVTFNDALAYAEFVGKRLPTEEEWEAAARGPKDLRYPWGDTWEPGRANDRDANRGGTAPVGSFPAGDSWCGAADLAGNVEEWTASNEDGEVVKAPLDSNLVQIVVRGGKYDSGPDSVAATFRWKSPGLATRKDHLGFRCAMSPRRDP